jgi:muramoyltetrapeptide carboxypeptidase
MLGETNNANWPPALRRGDKVGIIAPASQIDRARLEAGCATLRRIGYEPVYGESILDEDLYFAGGVERRVRELETMFERDDVCAIACARGGYGCNYLLPKIDIEKIRRHPKVFVGYSDITTLLTYFRDAGGLVTFHGPMVTKDFANPDGVHLPSWEAATSGAEFALDSLRIAGFKPLCAGRAEGVLYGGCLSMLAASLGTPYEVRTEGTILFLEDVGAKPYQIDRMLMQLKLAGKLKGVRGLVFGEMLDCVQPGGQAYSLAPQNAQNRGVLGTPLEEVVTRVVADLGVPVAYGLPSGHVSRENITLPIGARAELIVDGGAKLRIVTSG